MRQILDKGYKLPSVLNDSNLKWEMERINALEKYAENTLFKTPPKPAAAAQAATPQSPSLKLS